MDIVSLVMTAALLTASLPPGSALGSPAPRSRLARQVLVWWQGSGQVEWIDRPGTYELRFLCSYVHGAAEVLSVGVERDESSGRGAYRDCTPDEVRRLAAEGQEARVRFSDVLSGADLGDGATWPAVTGPDGGVVAVGARLSTVQGVWCMVPARDAESLRFARAAMQGDEVTVQGRLMRTDAAEAVVLVDGVRFWGEAESQDEPPWKVTVRWVGEEVAAFSAPGDYPVVVPCVHQGGGVERATLRLRQFRAVDLLVGGNAVRAELADTPEARSWGLQGRPGLAPDEGMLFYFEAPLQPIFVMRTVSFPIAVAFIAPDGTIVSIEKLNPGDAHGVTSPVPVNYVLEMEQSWFEKHGVGPGDVVIMP